MPEIVLPRFDWYAATVPVHPDAINECMTEVLDLSAAEWSPSRPMYGFSMAEVLQDAQGKRLTVLSGGQNGLRESHVVATGEDAQMVAHALRTHFPEHWPTRIDSCYDWRSGRSYSDLRAVGEIVQAAHGLTAYEHRPVGNDDAGATFYLGAPTSQVRVRMYEKGKQLPEAGHPEWVRAEVQFRPSGREERAPSAALSPVQVWGVSHWAADIATWITGAGVVPVDVRVHRRAQFERTHRALVQQYGNHLVRLWHLLGHDADQFAVALQAESPLVFPMPVQKRGRGHGMA